MAKYVISLDSGTTSVRTLMFDEKANIVSVSQEEINQYYPNEGWVEHDAYEIWVKQFDSLIDAIKLANKGEHQVKFADIKGIGVTNQRETILIWDKETGVPVYNAIVWQDRRTSDYCDELKQDPKNIEMIKEKTGLLLDPYFSATKLRWILNNVEGVRERAEKGELIAGTMDTWLIWKLSGRKSHFTDQTNASRTLLFNINTLEWDEELLELFDIPKNILPTVLNSSDDYGITSAGNEVERVDGIPIAAAIGDQQSSLYGHRSKIGELKATYGTGGFLVMNTGDKVINSKNGLLTTIAIGKNGKVEYALEGSIYIVGSVLKWLLEEVKLIRTYDEVDTYLKDKTADTSGVCVVPYFVGVGSPHWNAKVRGMITGLTRATSWKDIVKASAHSIALQTKDLFKAFEDDYGNKITGMSIDGGVAKGETLMQFLSDIVNVKLFLPDSPEVTALGVAYLAGLQTGVWSSEEEIDTLHALKRTYDPGMDKPDRDIIYNRWKKAAAAALQLEYHQVSE